MITYKTSHRFQSLNSDEVSCLLDALAPSDHWAAPQLMAELEYRRQQLMQGSLDTKEAAQIFGF